MLNVLVVISTGWAVRNFAESNFISELSVGNKVSIISPSELVGSLLKYKVDEDFEIVSADIPLVEPISWRLFRQAKKKLQQNILGSSTEGLWRKYVRRPIYQRFVGNMVDLVLSRRVCIVLFRLLERLELLVNQNSKIVELLGEERFDIVFLTNLSNFFDDSFANHFAKEPGVKKFFMVLSWDHVSSKVVLRTDFEKVFVWNKVSKTEILSLDLGFTDSSVIAVGAPQYESYKTAPTSTRKQWLSRIGIPSSSKVILFCTIPQQRTNDQHLKLEALIRNIRRSGKEYSVVIKLHPLDIRSVYDNLVQRNSDLLFFERTYEENWAPTGSDIELTKQSLLYSDVVINTFSTITIESAILDRPIIHIAYDNIRPANRIPCAEYYNFHHFKPIVEFEASIIVTCDNELFEAVERCLLEPGIKSAERRNLAEAYFDFEKNSIDALIHEFK